jgi:hypothetical protein
METPRPDANRRALAARHEQSDHSRQAYHLSGSDELRRTVRELQRLQGETCDRKSNATLRPSQGGQQGEFTGQLGATATVR